MFAGPVTLVPGSQTFHSRPRPSYASSVSNPFGSRVLVGSPRVGSNVVVVVWLSELATAVWIGRPLAMAYVVVVVLARASVAVNWRP